MLRRFLPLAVALLSAVAACAQDAGPFVGELSLVRYDMPIGRSDGFAPTRQLAVRVDGADAVDWPDFTLNGKPLWRDKAEAKVELSLRRGAEAASHFQMTTDDVIQPGGHWLRAMEWRQRSTHLYTADRTARCANTATASAGRYELWTFPVRIQGEGGPVVKNVELRYDGAVVFRKDGPWRTLTLLLPASEPGKKYELMVGGRGPVKFEAGLQPVKLGDPRERRIQIEAQLPGEGPKILVTDLSRPDFFPNQKEWDADVAALAKPLPGAFAFERGQGMARYLGVEVPRSPFTIYAAALPHGMSGGFYKKGMKADEYAAFVAETGYDTIFDPANALPEPGDAESLEVRAAALARRGVRLGLQYDNNWTRPSLQHPNLALFAHTLPEWHAPLYRSLSLAAQRFARLPNFAGIDIGAENAGHVSSWYWAPPIPNRPWGEAMIDFMGSPQPRVPRAPSLGPGELPFEAPVKTTAEFLRYADRYHAVFQQYGYFAEAVREVDPALVFTTGSFGSAPGEGARGGWPWASFSGRSIFSGLNTQQAYDWNAKRAAKPLHNVALTDRLRSYAPTKRTWALLDNSNLLHGREPMQRAAALALTRGIQGLGTNFLANPAGDGARPDVMQWQRELHDWIQRYGGVYARTEPEAAIGIFYSHQGALLRPVVGGEAADAAKLLAGSQEGKVVEALFLCHAAGWPARVVTYQEIARGPLPQSMRALLLVGLDEPDSSWTWSPGLEPMLRQFVESGGRILADEDSVCPVPTTKTGMQVAAYVTQSNMDPTPLLLARNAENIAKLRAAMRGAAEPIAVSDSPACWAIPTRSTDTQYITVVNQSVAEGDEAKEMLRPADPKATKPEIWKTKGNASLYAPPQVAALRWNTERPIYDVRLSRLVTADEAARVDLTKDAFQWFALPPAEVVQPELAVTKTSGFYEAKVSMRNPMPMGGIPVRLDVAGAQQSATVFTATGATARLPLHAEETPGEFTITATELLSGLARSVTVKIEPPEKPVLVQSSVRVRDGVAVRKFATRKHVALAIALTPEQQQDAAIATQARLLVDYYRKQGRIVVLSTVRAGGIVESLQPLRSPHRYPQWRTTATDLVLFGTPGNNVLLLDQARGQIFPRDFTAPAAGRADVLLTHSPFVGEYDVVNIIASDAAGIAAAVKTLTAGL